MATTNEELPLTTFEQHPIQLEDLLSRDTNGEACITEATLDQIWPRDDREPLVVVGKGVNLPPTCRGEFVPCEEKYGREYCLKAIGCVPSPYMSCEVKPWRTPETPQVPLPATGILLLTVLALMFMGRMFR